MRIVLTSSLCALLADLVVSDRDDDSLYTVACNLDDTLSVTIPYRETASVLWLEYGSCNFDGVSGKDAPAGVTINQGADFTINITLSINDCSGNNDAKPDGPPPANLTYDHSAFIVIGGFDNNGVPYVSDEVNVEANCQYIGDYNLQMDYNQMRINNPIYDTTNIIEMNFTVNPYTSDYSAINPNPSRRTGQMSYLGLSVTDNINHCQRHYVPRHCTYQEENGSAYTLIDYEATTCMQTIVGTTATWDGSRGMWFIEHLLFTFGASRGGHYSLVCQVTVCDKNADESTSVCKLFVNACMTEDEKTAFYDRPTCT